MYLRLFVLWMFREDPMPDSDSEEAKFAFEIKAYS